MDAVTELLVGAVAAFWRHEWATAIVLAHAAEHAANSAPAPSDRLLTVRNLIEASSEDHPGPNDVPNWLKHHRDGESSKPIDGAMAALSVHGAVREYEKAFVGVPLPEAVQAFLLWVHHELARSSSPDDTD